MFRVGIGYDTHRLKEGLPLVIGGVSIPHRKGLVAHSDGDVLLHALMDALLGAAGGIEGKRDLGAFFPDTDPAYKGANSLNLLAVVWKAVRPRYTVENIDAVLLCQKPKLAPYLEAMEKNLVTLLGGRACNIKATTTEGMNAEGEEKCISAQVVCLLKQKTPS